MTNLSPNDLSHLSDEAFKALCPQGEHAPGPEPLSPAAQAVLDAVNKELDEAPNAHCRWDLSFLTGVSAAAALRAAADQVASPIPDDCTADVFNRQLDIRAKILAIATELDNQP
jgi:hypothetical protein